MPILNYTTKIPTDKTIGEIQRLLSKNGATKIVNDYDGNGYIIAISFGIMLDGREIGFRLPSDWRPVLQVMKNDRNTPRRYLTDEQALRVSWRIIKVWLEAQMAMLQTRMVKLEQIFLPYAITRNGKTLYENFSDNPGLLLGSGEP